MVKLSFVSGSYKWTSGRPTLITGYRVAIAVLLRDAKLRPDVDYIVNYSFGQRSRF